MSTHQPFSNFEPPEPKWSRRLQHIAIYVLAVIALVALYGVTALVDQASDRRVREQPSETVELAAALESQRLQLADEFGGSVREAYKQGWSEALASVDSSDRGEAFAHACRRLWQGQQP